MSLYWSKLYCRSDISFQNQSQRAEAFIFLDAPYVMKLFCLHPGTRSSMFRVDIAPNETIYDLKMIIKREMPNTYAHLEADQLDLFLAKRGNAWLADDDKRGDVDDLLMQPLRSTTPVGQVFRHLTVGTIHVLVRKRLTGRLLGVPVKRLERWDELNRGFGYLMDHVDEAHAQTENKISYASLTWDDISAIYNPLLDATYRQQVTPVPEATLDFLERIFTMKHASYRSTSRFFAPPPLPFVEPILLAVASLLQPVGHIELDKHFDGGYLNVDGTVDMMLTQAMGRDVYKRVCVVEVKDWDDVMADMARALVAMEVVSQRDRVETTYAIVTDFTRWRFLKRSDKEIGVDDDTVELERGVCEEVGRIAGKVLSMFL
jgi:hypothetical protein